MSKKTITATFSDGSMIERSSAQLFGWAWAAYANNEFGQSSRGFASTKEKAQVAAQRFFPAKEYKNVTTEVVATQVA
mgnify:CR=1